MSEAINSLIHLQKLLGSMPASSSGSYRQDFANISKANLDLVEDIMNHARHLKAKKRYAEAEIFLGFAGRILDNNQQLQNKVGEVLSKID